jgi:lysophospholipase L1-like esterase
MPTPTPAPAGVLSQWHTALDNRNSSTATWLAYGDSLVEGQGASSRVNRWLDKTLNNVRGTYPTAGVPGGVGYLPGWYANYAPDSTWEPYTSRSGTVNDVEWAGSLGERAIVLNRNASQTYTVYGTSAEIWYAKYGGTLSYAVDGITKGSIATSGTYSVNNKITLTFPTRGTHTVTVKSTSGQVLVEGVVAYDGDETRGIRMFDHSHCGYSTSSYQANRQYLNTLLPMVNPDLVTIDFIGNDYIHVYNTPEQAKANLKSEIANIRSVMASRPPSIALMLPYDLTNTPPDSGSYTWAQYKAVVLEVLAEDPSLGLIDLSNMDTTGRFASDGLHLNDAGQAEVARIVTEYISAR